MTTPQEPTPGGNVITRTIDRIRDLIHRERARHPWFDHLVHAGGHYNRAQADTLAAAVTYYAFLALFPVVLLLASIAGFVLAGNTALQLQLIGAVQDAVPGKTGSDLAQSVVSAINARSTTGVIGLVGFLVVGLGAVDKLRVGMDVVWRGEPDQPDFLGDRLKDLLVLLGLAAAGVLSIGLSTGTTAAASLVFDALGIDEVPGFFLLTAVLGIGLALVGDTLVFLWVLKGVPNTPHRARMLLPGAVFGAVGFEVLKFLGGYYLNILSGNVTVSALGGFVGLIIWINVLARFGFFTACWTATLPAVEHSDAQVPYGPAAPTRLPDVVLVDERGPRPAPLGLAAGLLGAGALMGAAAGRWLPVAVGRRRRAPDRGRRRDGAAADA
ncbi:membrane protein [Klenkia soli]|uniref:Membrane protein n=1 Tax=Klenkia soli TaxID=1052260 RepID=A0A1H0J021_9ACTN|nr:membrane protein [Klenkia soli]